MEVKIGILVGGLLESGCHASGYRTRSAVPCERSVAEAARRFGDVRSAAKRSWVSEISASGRGRR